MKSLVYAIKDDSLGIPLLIEAELCDFEDGEPPIIVINEITSSFNAQINQWALSKRYLDILRDKIYQEWCMEVNRSIKHG